MQRDVQRHAGLAHTGTRSDQDQFTSVQAEDGFVQIGQAGRQTGDAPAAARRLRQARIHALDHHGHRLQAADIASLPQGIDLPLRRFEHGVRLAGAFEDHIVDLVRRDVQVAQQRLVAHDCRVLEHVCRRRRNLHDLHQILLRGVLAVYAAHLHLLQHGDGVDALPVGEHGEDRVKNVAVRLNIKFVGLDLVDHIRDAGRVDQHRADDRLLRRGGVGRLSAKQLLHDVCLPWDYLSSMTSTLTVPVIS